MPFQENSLKMIVDTESWVNNHPLSYQEKTNHNQDKAPKTLLRLVVDGAPVPQPRFRVNYKTRALYNPEKKQLQDLRNCLKGMVGARSLPIFGRSCFLRVSIDFYFKRPRSHFVKNGQELAKNAPKYPAGGDVDNFLKFVLDAGNNILYHDDSQVKILSGSLQYCINNEGPSSFDCHVSNI